METNKTRVLSQREKAQIIALLKDSIKIVSGIRSELAAIKTELDTL